MDVVGELTIVVEGAPLLTKMLSELMRFKNRMKADVRKWLILLPQMCRLSWWQTAERRKAAKLVAFDLSRRNPKDGSIVWNDLYPPPKE